MLMTPEFFKFILNYLSFKSLDKECSHMKLDPSVVVKCKKKLHFEM